SCRTLKARPCAWSKPRTGSHREPGRDGIRCLSPLLPGTVARRSQPAKPATLPRYAGTHHRRRRARRALDRTRRVAHDLAVPRRIGRRADRLFQAHVADTGARPAIHFGAPLRRLAQSRATAAAGARIGRGAVGSRPSLRNARAQGWLHAGNPRLPRARHARAPAPRLCIRHPAPSSTVDRVRRGRVDAKHARATGRDLYGTRTRAPRSAHTLGWAERGFTRVKPNLHGYARTRHRQ